MKAWGGGVVGGGERQEEEVEILKGRWRRRRDERGGKFQQLMKEWKMLEMLEVGHRVGVAQWGDQGTNQLPAAADPPGSETNQKRLDHFPEFLTSNTNINKFMRLFAGFGFSKNNRPIEHALPPPRGEQQKCKARDHQEENCSCNVWHGFFLV